MAADNDVAKGVRLRQLNASWHLCGIGMKMHLQLHQIMNYTERERQRVCVRESDNERFWDAPCTGPAMTRRCSWTLGRCFCWNCCRLSFVLVRQAALLLLFWKRQFIFVLSAARRRRRRRRRRATTLNCWPVVNSWWFKQIKSNYCCCSNSNCCCCLSTARITQCHWKPPTLPPKLNLRLIVN